MAQTLPPQAVEAILLDRPTCIKLTEDTRLCLVKQDSDFARALRAAEVPTPQGQIPLAQGTWSSEDAWQIVDRRLTLEFVNCMRRVVNRPISQDMFE